MSATKLKKFKGTMVELARYCGLWNLILKFFLSKRGRKIISLIALIIKNKYTFKYALIYVTLHICIRYKGFFNSYVCNLFF